MTITQNGELKIIEKDETIVFDDNMYIDYEGRLYKVRITDFFTNFQEGEEFYELSPEYLYLNGDYFFPYRGKIENVDENLPVGVYLISEDKSDNHRSRDIFYRFPMSDEEREEFYYRNKISTVTAAEIRDKINSGEALVMTNDSVTAAVISMNNNHPDVFKRAAIAAQIAKHIDIDSCSHRFPTKNAACNYKQAINNPETELSAKIFKRAMEAFGLKFTIIIEDAVGESVGTPLNEKIVISSEDTYEVE